MLTTHSSLLGAYSWIGDGDERRAHVTDATGDVIAVLVVARAGARFRYHVERVLDGTRRGGARADCDSAIRAAELVGAAWVVGPLRHEV